MGYGSTPLHYPLHPSIDGRCCIGVVQRHYAMPGPVVSLCHGSPMHAWLVTGFMKESSRLDLHASKYRVESGRIFVRPKLHPCLRRGGKRGRKYGSSPWKRFADRREISNEFKQRFGKIHAQKLSPGDTRDNLKRFAQSRERRDGKNNEWNGIPFPFLFFFLSIPQLHREIDRSTFQPLKSYGCPI